MAAADTPGIIDLASAHDGNAWAKAYAQLADALPATAARARPVIAGFSAFVDALVRLEDANALFADGAPPEARQLGEELVRRAQAGIGGEIALPWPAGDAFLGATLPHVTRVGGTSAQIANVLAPLGIDVLMALADRSAAQLGVLDRQVLLADGEGLVRAGAVAAGGTAKPRHWIFETTVGASIRGETVRRSTRVIVRLADDGPEIDVTFALASPLLAARAGGAVLSSLVSTPDDQMDQAIATVASLAKRWRAAGLAFVHQELADYGSRPALPEKLLTALQGTVTSVGMSLSEWRALSGDAALTDTDAVRRFAERWSLDRVAIHADEWALAVTRGDPAREKRALMTGCLLAAARAGLGRHALPVLCPADACFEPLPAFAPLADGWSVIACPAPYLPSPKSTIGLGDTFVAGCLLVLGQPAP
ncbi:ADP-dependent phosphofructokinase/glucokinase [Kaistia soli DSM 19436]|uniref:ADP-dependent phosphofructokinase/glucokinase n=1 Tax=Kaistia soli DSM 19436 TaxID=1122133 RepID=A0A1M4U4E0_9HYPH|nr:ADP-dependent glucokinase/phosphofructokinase [Kaistia soli]SHE51609.1 ADP-dependent phosphofructokinase/glucokinase [Kaistia soli DSM 19436]